MMLKIMNTREVKKLAGQLADRYGVDPNLFDGLVLMRGGGDVWAASRECLQADLTGLTVDSIGLQIIRAGKPTVHGVQLLFETAEATELPEEDALTFIGGGMNLEGVVSYRRHPLDLGANR